MTEFGKQFWEERYGGDDRVWSGNPNVQLVAEVGDLPPGTALDAGCGEGADAVWLASRGWTVTAVDLASAAIRRARQHSADVKWLAADLTTWRPPDTYDLVTSQYVHPDDPKAYFAMLADAVAPGGTLLVVGHDPSDPHTAHLKEHGVHFTAAEDFAGLLDDGWHVDVAEARRRRASHHHGEGTETVDAVLKAVRLE